MTGFPESANRPGAFSRNSFRACVVALLLGVFSFVAVPASAAQTVAPKISSPPDAKSAAKAALQDYALAAGDQIKISVFQNPDLMVETRVSENGMITFPLIGAVQVGGASTLMAEKKIAKMLKDGGFLVDPQVTVLIEQIHGNQVAALGQFNKPGRYPLETTNMKLSDLIAEAGGIAPTGSDTVIFSGYRNGKPVWRDIDVGTMYSNNQADNDFVLQSGDVLFVDRYPLFYIYGEVQRPGNYRVERDMTFMQALATGGGLTPRGTTRGMKLKRKNDKGEVKEYRPDMDDKVQPGDVIVVQESLF
jgi:polysaccharide export outer membrane protein